MIISIYQNCKVETLLVKCTSVYISLEFRIPASTVNSSAHAQYIVMVKKKIFTQNSGNVKENTSSAFSFIKDILYRNSSLKCWKAAWNSYKTEMNNLGIRVCMKHCWKPVHNCTSELVHSGSSNIGDRSTSVWRSGRLLHLR